MRQLEVRMSKFCVWALRIAQGLVYGHNVEIDFFFSDSSVLLKVEEFFLNIILSSVLDAA